MAERRIPFTDIDERLKRDGYDPCDPSFSFQDWLAETTFPDGLAHLAAYASVCWPEFVEFEDCVFLKERFSETTYRDFLASCLGDKSAVESVVNHEHIADMFGLAITSAEYPSRELIVHVGRLLKEMAAAGKPIGAICSSTNEG